MKTYSAIASAVAVAMLLTLGCESGPSEVKTLQPSVKLSTNHKTILVGESTMLFAQSQNLLGRQPQINWSSTFGTITPTGEGRMALFSSDVPGTAVITAEVSTADLIVRDTINVTVNSAR